MTWQPDTYAEGLRMAWDEPDDGIDHCLAQILPYLPDEGIVVDVGCGVGRLTVPVADARPALSVVGFDTSPEMIRHAPTRGNVSYETEWSGRMYDGAFSVVTFQHMPDDAMIDYLRKVAWCDRAPFVFQFVEGTERAPLSMQRSAGWVREWCHAAGYRLVDMWTDERFDNWRWVHAR